ncbi:aminotransferase [Microbacterium sp. E-13]|uniref:aminotransferase n=1 Tax=Microbacterium sp. E-13 TaxID=3404048 RepID=UPI003CEF22EC
MTERIFNYFDHVGLPSPTVPRAEVQRLLSERFQLSAEVDSLGSQQDQNFLLRHPASGEPFAVLKIANPVFSESEMRMQAMVADRIAEREPDLRVPRVLTGERGPLADWWDTSQGRLYVRVIEHLEGRALTGSRYLAPSVVARLGDLSARVSRALHGLTHPAAARVHQWDLQHAERVIDTLAPLEPDDDIRRLITDAAHRAVEALDHVVGRLPRQLGHFDITDDNVMALPGPRALPDAVIDFGDATESWAVGELAVTISSVLHHEGQSPLSTVDAVRAFHRIRPLSQEEVDAIWPLVVLRGAVLVLSGRQQVRLDAANDYAGDALDREYRIFEEAMSVPSAVMAGVFRSALDMDVGAAPAWAGPGLLPHGGTVVELDARVTSPLNDDGRWLSPDAVREAAEAALDSGADVVVLPFGDVVATGAPRLAASAPATVPTHATIWLAAVRRFAVPDGGAVEQQGGGARVALGDVMLSFSAARVAGDSVELPSGTAIRLQLTRTGIAEVPLFTPPGYAPGWLTIAGDPAPALGLPAARGARGGRDLLQRRENVLAEVQEHYYARPPQIERGWREHLVGVDGRVYLDMVNNVTSVGHAHPRITAAATRQFHLLNTNSRFHYAAITEYGEKIAATLPEELDTVFFVNSGSEAIDLSLRLAMAATGRRDVVAMREAYHGWTYASDAVSTSIADNPNALQTRPEWVHTVDAANSYRGIHRGEAASRYAPEAAAVIRWLMETGEPPAAFISETYYGNAGGVALPPGYLREVYAAVRESGGLAIADEVQVGFGRLGTWFWGFEQQGVVPDIVAVAKSVGNGQPIGVVVTRRAVADRYRTQGYFFSSTGGSPVSAVIGSTVLDIIQTERLQHNARVVGEHLKQRLEKLGETYPIVGRVHGDGLYLGLEFVRDRETLEPATEETAAICDRLLELGVIMQPTGDHQNVLKIKPPLCVARESVDYFVDAVERVLRTGW